MKSGRRLAWSLEVTRRDCEGIHLVLVAGRLGTRSSGLLADTLEQVLAAGHRSIVVDCGGVDYVSSAGVVVFERVGQVLGDRGGRLVLSGLQEPVRVSLELAGVLTRLDVAGTVTEALAVAARA